MTDRPNDRNGWPDGGIEPDPDLTAALRSMEPPPHGEGFWDRLDGRLDAEALAAPVTVATLPPVPPAPPLAEVVPLPAPRRRGPQRWLAAAAAALVVVLAATALFRSTSTDVTTVPPAATSTVAPETSTSAPPSNVPEAPPTSSPATTVGGPGTTPDPAAATPAPPRLAPPTTARRPTVPTTGVDPLVLSPAGVGPLRMGMTVQQARATRAMTDFFDQSGNGTCGVGYGAGAYRRSDLGALFLNGRLARVFAEGDSRLRTPQGIGIGSPASALSSVPGARTEQPAPYLEGATDVLITEGGTGYLFTVQQGIVRLWSAGTGEALGLPEGCS